ncbi:HK97 family phage prohead protease [Halosquirtibacter xylanolyticus]|uniref:HK97 family phage prohead protease n=1 Tax=Halosquirtibacter xylanolyticus TaxID=3374599 RepID=UPI00374911B6|nr:HK97 family phage prohead protease [Prolixibacteraceae bacterium]
MDKYTLKRNIKERIQVRSEEGENGERYIEGYASIFNHRSKLLREWGDVFYEEIAPGAFDNILQDTGLNCLATVDHCRSKMLGRTISGTLELSVDEKGLKYRIKVPNTTLGNDIYEMVSRGDYYESSFIFSIAEKGITVDRSEEIEVRKVTDILKLWDISIVIDGAYADTQVNARSKEFQFEQEGKQRKTSSILLKQRKREVEFLKLFSNEN